MSFFSSLTTRSRCRLAIRSLLRSRTVSGSKRESTEDPSGLLRIKSYVVAKPPKAGVVRKFGEMCQIRCRPRHQVQVQNTRSVLKCLSCSFKTGL
ncbi:hypothetical protein AVEN_127887-1 [Araneus ventricosus]|uniref:Uncharacterized protein n=1 Tax=Araneus ventricosus TaxID=182803 RepID=A0A4Y1ZYP3_ARAVE|nr:hypothetical protein AVEN_127887-1 [Araneus ventricosus]